MEYSFTSYQDALEWIQSREKAYQSRNAFYGSEEYKRAYPIVKTLYDVEHNKLSAKAAKAMNDVGVIIGDRVFYDNVSPFGIAEEYTGTLIDRKGIPYVKLDEGQRTISGAESVRWHKGWKKIRNDSKVLKYGSSISCESNPLLEYILPGFGTPPEMAVGSDLK